MTVDDLLKVFVSNAGGFVIACVVAAACGYALWVMVRGRITDMEHRINHCEARHNDCEDRNRQLAMAMLELASGNDIEAVQRARTVLGD